MIDHCTHCGQVLPPEGDALGLTPQQRQVYDAVKLRPRTKEQLGIVLWSDRPNEPELKTVHAIVSQMNLRLRRHGITMKWIDGRYYIQDYYGDTIIQPTANHHPRRLDSRAKPARKAS